MKRLSVNKEGKPMKKILTVMIALGVSVCVANAFPETSSSNTATMQQLQNLDRFKDPGVTDFKNYRTNREKRKEEAQKVEQRREYLEQRARTIQSQDVQFVNENGVIKIERR